MASLGVFATVTRGSYQWNGVRGSRSSICGLGSLEDQGINHKMFKSIAVLLPGYCFGGCSEAA